MLEAGTWGGGYVEGMGYVAPKHKVTPGSGSSSYGEDDSLSEESYKKILTSTVLATIPMTNIPNTTPGKVGIGNGKKC